MAPLLIVDNCQHFVRLGKLVLAYSTSEGRVVKRLAPTQALILIESRPSHLDIRDSYSPWQDSFGPLFRFCPSVMGPTAGNSVPIANKGALAQIASAFT